MKKYLLVLTVFLMFVASSFSLISAYEVGKEAVNPDKKFDYNVKRLKEKIGLAFKFSSDKKIDYYQTLLNRRLNELSYITSNKLAANIENASTRYETTAGQLTEYMLAKGASQEQKKEVVSQIEEHQKIVAGLKDGYDATTAEWRFVMNDYNSLEIYKGKLLNSTP
ncbi:MAG: DUF5667 domain-containing protein [Patescibacteria group bacterium]